MKHLRSLVEGVDFLEGMPAPGMIVGNMDAVNYVPVLKGEKWLLAYSAQGISFELRLGGNWSGAKAQWFNPRSGELGETFCVQGDRIVSFDPPSAGRGSDWVLRMIRE